MQSWSILQEKLEHKAQVPWQCEIHFTLPSIQGTVLEHFPPGHVRLCLHALLLTVPGRIWALGWVRGGSGP